MRTTLLLAGAVATMTGAVATATAIADRNDHESSAAPPTAVATSTGQTASRTPAPRAAAARVLDLDADLLFEGRLRLEAETSGADRVTFTYRGHRYRGRLVEIDREDATREWARTITARGADRRGARRITIRAQACDGSRCSTRSESEFLERPERDD